MHGNRGQTGDGAADTVFSALTPEGIEYTLHPAGPLARGLAFAIDTFIQWAVLLGAWLFSAAFQAAFGLWFVLLLKFAIDWFYHVVCELLLGQSPGKRVAGIRVVLRDGSPVTLTASLLRNLLRFADTFLFLFQTALIVMCLSRGFRRIGDFVGDTVVVYTSASRLLAPQGYVPSGQITAAPPLDLEEKQALIMFARRYALLGDSRSSEIVKPWTDALGFHGPGSEGAYALSLAKNWTGER